MSEHVDVIVVGGGPAGATVATFVAMQGHRVLLLEKEQFPIHKIGESLLPSTVNGICAMLGLTEELEAANFIRKRGGTFRWGTSPEPWTISFSMSARMNGPTSYAYQVERMKFDTILLDNAERKGVDVRQRHAALHPIVENGRVVGVLFRDHAEATREARARFVVDASGWTTTLSRQVGERVTSPFFRNVAVFGYFTRAGRMPEPNSGNIFCAAFDYGWFWFIPLSATLTSVGVVVGEEHRQVLHEAPAAVLASMVERCPPIRELLAGAERVTTGPYGQVRVRRDYSYCHSRFWQPGLALIGDAACFIDPVFSSGVHLATYAGLLAARSINTCLRGESEESRPFNEFERRYRREYRYFYDFLVAFYDMEQDLDSYYWSARRVLRAGGAPQEAFINLIAGIGGSGERLFASSEAFSQEQAARSRHLFGGIARAGASSLMGADTKGRAFLGDLFTELSQVQLQAQRGEHRAKEQPLFEGGMVPSADGLHWAAP